MLYWITTDQLVAIVSSILGDNPATCPSNPSFSSFHNCTDWVSEKFTAGGVPLPAHRTIGIADPGKLISQMKAIPAPFQADCSGGTLSPLPPLPQPHEYFAIGTHALTDPAAVSGAFGLTRTVVGLGSVNASIGHAVSLQISGLSPSAGVRAVDWGDGSNDFYTNMAHVYQQAGQYALKLAIVDRGGVVTYNCVVNVNGASGTVTIPISHTISPPSSWVNQNLVPAGLPGLVSGVSSYGSSCGAQSAPYLLATRPSVGNDVRLTLVNHSAVSLFGALLIGVPHPTGLPLPNRCVLWVDPAGPTTLSGAAVQPQTQSETLLKVPNSASLLGARIMCQDVLIEPATTLAATPGMALFIGP